MNLSVTLQSLVDEHGFDAVQAALSELEGATTNSTSASTGSGDPKDPTQPGTGPGHDPKP